jgi:hypothetical protein
MLCSGACISGFDVLDNNDDSPLKRVNEDFLVNHSHGTIFSQRAGSVSAHLEFLPSAPLRLPA